MPKADTIRNRRSYAMFNNIYEAFQQGNVEQLLLTVHHELDKRQAFGNEAAANWAKEALMQVLEDKKNPKETYDK